MDKEEARATSSASRAKRDATPSDPPILSRSRVLASTPGTGAAQRGLGVGNQKRRHGKLLRRMAENGTVRVKPFGAGVRGLTLLCCPMVNGPSTGNQPQSNNLSFFPHANT